MPKCRRHCHEEAAPGRTMCDYHLREHREREGRNALKRKAAGLCVVGCGLPRDGDRIRCKNHHAIYSQYMIQWRKK